jgi:cytidylate kinase
MVRIITVAREYGSGGAEIAQRVAGLLGWNLIDRALIDRVAEFANVPVSATRAYDERNESMMERLLEGFRAAWQEICAGPPPAVFDARAMHALTEHVIRTAARTGNCIIVGRGSQCILSARADTLHVFVYAPPAFRISRLQSRYPDEKDVRRLMVQADHDRALYVHQHYHCDWADRCLYDMCLNSRRGIGATAALIHQAVKSAHRGTNDQTGRINSGK